MGCSNVSQGCVCTDINRGNIDLPLSAVSPHIQSGTIGAWVRGLLSVVCKLVC